MKLWIDDVRPAPEGYKHCTNVNEVQVHCCQMIDPCKILHIEEFNLDHDAGNYYSMGGDYIQILNWLEQKQCAEGWVIKTVFHIHSQNPVGVENMRAIIKRNGWVEV